MSTWRSRDAEEVVDEPLEVGGKLLEVAEEVSDVRDDRSRSPKRAGAAEVSRREKVGKAR
jgi:hypothetical protein